MNLDLRVLAGIFTSLSLCTVRFQKRRVPDATIAQHADVQTSIAPVKLHGGA